jgi:ABC-type transport system involved in multi-copper enzyme maturation permease subunit
MIWLTWRQFRWQAVTAAAVLAVLAIAVGATGPGLGTRFDQAGLSTCHSQCSSLASNFIDDLRGTPYAALFFGSIVLLYLAPALMGIFWGAPLIARELEAGTYRLAWNQSITRTRWSVVKLGVIGLAAVGTAGLLSLMISWWASPIDHAMNLVGANSGFAGTRLSPVVFAARGVAPLGYAAFAFALGVTAGVLIRRTLPAMAVTLVVFAAVQFLVPNFVRPDLIPPVQMTAPFNANTANEIMTSSTQGGSSNTMTVVGDYSRAGAWMLSNKTITPAGKVFTGPAAAACTGNSTPQQCNNWLDSLHLRQQVTYQPASRFWPLQWLETGIYLILAAGLAWLCAWQVRRRRG